jgi:hypothetical protein
MAVKLEYDLVINTSSVSQATDAVDKLGKKLDDTTGKDGKGGMGGLGQSAAKTGNELKGAFKGASDALKGFGVSTQGAGTAFKALGAVIKANPIMLLVTVIIGIVTALVSLKDSIPLVGKAFEVIGDIIDGVVGALKDFSDWLGLSDFKGQEKAKNTLENAQKEQDAIEKRFNKEIKLAEAAGKDTERLEKEKQQAVIDSVNVQIKALEALGKAQGKLSDEQKKQLEELKTSLENAQTELAVIELKGNKKREDEQKKVDDKKKEDAKKALEEKKKAVDDLNKAELDAQRQAQLALAKDEFEKLELKNKFAQEDLKNKFAKFETDKKIQKELNDALLALDQQLAADRAALQAKIDADDAKKRDEKAKKDEEQLKKNADKSLSDQIKLLDVQLAGLGEFELEKKKELLQRKFDLEISNENLTADEKKIIQEQFNQDSLALEEENAEKKKELNQQTTDAVFNASKGLSDAIFAIQLAGVEKGSAAELKIRKKQFAVDKAFSVGRAVIDGIRSVQAALTIPPPAGQILAVTNGVLAAANIAKILATKFDPGTSGGGGGGGSSPSPNLAGPTQPTSTFQNPNLQAVGGGAGGGTTPKQPVIKAIVVSSDITKEQGADTILERRASY